MKALLTLISAFAQRALGLWAEFGNQVTVAGFTAAANLNAAGNQYTVMRLASATTVNICSEVLVSGALKAPFGVLQNLPKSGEQATIAVLGLSKVRGGGTVTAGAKIAHNSSGMVVDAVSGDVSIGTALETATTAGEIITALIHIPIKWGSVA